MGIKINLEADGTDPADEKLMALFRGALELAVDKISTHHKYSITRDDQHAHTSTWSLTAEASPLTSDSTDSGDEAAGQDIDPLQCSPEQKFQCWKEFCQHTSIPPLSFDACVAEACAKATNPKQLAASIVRDPLLTAKVLGVYNAAVLGQRGKMVSMERAVLGLGFNMVQAIAEAYAMEMDIMKWLPFPRSHFRFVRRTAAAAGLLTGYYAAVLRLPNPEILGLTALLMRMGALLLAMKDDSPCSAYLKITDEATRIEFEEKQWGISTQQLSACLLEHWGMPQSLCRLVGLQTIPLILEVDPNVEGTRELSLFSVALALGTARMFKEQVDPHSILTRAVYSTLKKNLQELGMYETVLDAWDDQRLQGPLGAAIA